MRATLGTKLYTWLNGEKVGEDEFGNVYFRHKKPQPDTREKRWVLYRHEEEATHIPPAWHAWIHHMTDKLPEEINKKRKKWQRPHMPNLTGTKFTYRPQGHFLKGGKRAPARGDYEAWKP